MSELERWSKAIDEYGELIPHHLVEGIKRYVLYGQPVGDFLTNVFENNFMGIVGRADATNMFLLPVYAQLLYNATPTLCHGSPARVTDWIEMGGIKGMELAALKGEDDED